MIPERLKKWCCKFLNAFCNYQNNYLKVFTKSACFFERGFCLETHWKKVLATNRQPNCNYYDYLNNLIWNQSSSSCNVTIENLSNFDKSERALVVAKSRSLAIIWRELARYVCALMNWEMDSHEFYIIKVTPKSNLNLSSKELISLEFSGSHLKWMAFGVVLSGIFYTIYQSLHRPKARRKASQKKSEDFPRTIYEKNFESKSSNEILKIKKSIKNLEKEVEDFKGNAEDRTFLHLKELLIRTLIQLDDVDINNPSLMSTRKELIQLVDNCLNNLENKAVLKNQIT